MTAVGQVVPPSARKAAADRAAARPAVLDAWHRTGSITATAAAIGRSTHFARRVLAEAGVRTEDDEL